MSTIELDIYSLAAGGSGSAPTFLGTLTTAFDVSFRVELYGTGSGQFSMTRTDAQASSAYLQRRRLVKVRIPDVSLSPIFAFFLETGDFTLASSDEEGGEILTFGGRGILSYLEFAVMWKDSYVGTSPGDNTWRLYAAGGGNKPGQILKRVVDEITHASRPQHPVPLLTEDFDYTNDSSSDPWDADAATEEFTASVGEDCLSIAQRLIGTGAIIITMSPDFALQAWNQDTYGRDLTSATFAAGKVRLEKGVNIVDEVVRELPGDESATHILVGGEDNTWGTSALGDAGSRITKETYVDAWGTSPTSLAGVGLSNLQRRLAWSEHVNIPIVALDNELVGYYLPGPVGTSGHVWVGDLIRLHTGTGNQDFNEEDVVVAALTVSVDPADNLQVIVEIGPTSPVPPGGGGGTPPTVTPPGDDTPEVPLDLEDCGTVGYSTLQYSGYACEGGGWDWGIHPINCTNGAIGSYHVGPVGWPGTPCGISLGYWMNGVWLQKKWTFVVPADSGWMEGVIRISNNRRGHGACGYYYDGDGTQNGYGVSLYGDGVTPPSYNALNDEAFGGISLGGFQAGSGTAELAIPLQNLQAGATISIVAYPLFHCSCDDVCHERLRQDGGDGAAEMSATLALRCVTAGSSGWYIGGVEEAPDGSRKTFTIRGGYVAVRRVWINGQILATDQYVATDGITITLDRAPLATDSLLVERYLTQDRSVDTGNAAGTGQAYDALVGTSQQAYAFAGNAAGTGQAYDATVAIATETEVAEGSGSTIDSGVQTGKDVDAGNAAGTGTAHDPTVSTS